MRRLFLCFVVAAGASHGAQSLDVSAVAQQALADQVDRALATAWEAGHLHAAPPADDATWLRRLSVDLRGAIPGRDEVAQFLADPATDKRSRKIDDYLADREFARDLSFEWCNILFATAPRERQRTEMTLRPWLEEQFHRRMPFGEIVRHIVADSDTSPKPGSTAFIITFQDSIETLAGSLARSFLGLQIQCAQCHDHPNDHWKRSDFNRFTGFLADLRADKVAGQHVGQYAAFRVIDRSPEWDFTDRLRTMIMQAQKPPRTRPDAMQSEMTSSDGSSEMASAADSDLGIDIPLDAPPDMSIGSAPRTSSDQIALNELQQLTRSTHKGENALRELEADPKRQDDLLGRLPFNARELVRKYHDRRELFSEAGFLDGKPWTPSETTTRRAALAEWIVGADNPWFGRALANRIWAGLFGKGLIEPIDDLSGGKDQVLPELLDLLGREFVQHGTDLRFLIGALARTKAYALGSYCSGDHAQGGAAERIRCERWFAAHPMRPFTTEQALYSLMRATELTDAELLTRRNSSVDAERDRKTRIDALKRACGSDPTTGDRLFSPSIPQALFLVNGEYTNRGSDLKQSPTLAVLADAALPVTDGLRQLFFATLSRPPSEQETARLAPLVSRAAAGRSKAIEDLCWALLSSTEFHTNH